EEHRDQHAEAGKHDPRPGRVLVEPEGGAGAHQQQRARGDDRPVRRLRDEVVRPGARGGGAHRNSFDQLGLFGTGVALSLAALPSTSKNVYESVIVPTSFGSAGSTMKTTGIRRVSPAASVCFRKQKQSSLRKYWPASRGQSLWIAWPVTGWSVVLTTSNSACVTAPGWMSVAPSTARNFHGRLRRF